MMSQSTTLNNGRSDGTVTPLNIVEESVGDTNGPPVGSVSASSQSNRDGTVPSYVSTTASIQSGSRSSITTSSSFKRGGGSDKTDLTKQQLPRVKVPLVKEDEDASTLPILNASQDSENVSVKDSMDPPIDDPPTNNTIRGLMAGSNASAPAVSNGDSSLDAQSSSFAAATSSRGGVSSTRRKLEPEDSSDSIAAAVALPNYVKSLSPIDRLALANALNKSARESVAASLYRRETRSRSSSKPRGIEPPGDSLPSLTGGGGGRSYMVPPAQKVKSTGRIMVPKVVSNYFKSLSPIDKLALAASLHPRETRSSSSKPRGIDPPGDSSPSLPVGGGGRRYMVPPAQKVKSSGRNMNYMVPPAQQVMSTGRNMVPQVQTDKRMSQCDGTAPTISASVTSTRMVPQVQTDKSMSQCDGTAPTISASVTSTRNDVARSWPHLSGALSKIEVCPFSLESFSSALPSCLLPAVLSDGSSSVRSSCICSSGVPPDGFLRRATALNASTNLFSLVVQTSDNPSLAVIDCMTSFDGDTKPEGAPLLVSEGDDKQSINHHNWCDRILYRDKPCKRKFDLVSLHHRLSPVKYRRIFHYEKHFQSNSSSIGARLHKKLDNLSPTGARLKKELRFSTKLQTQDTVALSPEGASYIGRILEEHFPTVVKVCVLLAHHTRPDVVANVTQGFQFMFLFLSSLSKTLPILHMQRSIPFC
jgi:hypothetical protein